MIRDRLLRYASRLRFPKLLTLTIALFLTDLVIPDLIPLVDELLLGLVAAMLALLRDKRQVRDK